MMKNIRPIRNEDDLKWAIDEITPYFDQPPAKGSTDADRFDVLSDLIEAYENRGFALAEYEPIEFLQGFMEMTGRTQSDLAELFESRSRASEILNRRRALTVEMIFKLKQNWGLPADCLLKPYALAVA